MHLGLLSGVLWALDTIILGIALAATPFVESNEAIFLAPFVSTFLHDTFSAIWMGIYMIIKKDFKNSFKALKTRSGRFIALGALLGGPVGMTGYLMAIQNIGPSYTAIISSLYPAIGAFFAFIFLKEKMKKSAIVGLLISVTGIILLGYVPGGEVNNLLVGFFFAIMCVIGWASEAVICAYGMKDDEVSPEQSLQIRQFVSGITYGFLIIPIVKGFGVAGNVLMNRSTLIVIIVAAFAGTASYVFYYKAINKIGATKAMSLNITYSAWAIVFGIFILGNKVDFKSIVCCLMIISGSILAAGDINELGSLFKRNKSSNEEMNYMEEK